MTTTSPLPEPFARIAGVVRAIAVLPDGNRVVVGGDVPAVPVLDLRTGAVWASLDRPSSTLLAAAATLDDRIVLCGTDDITEWQLGDLSSYGGAVVSGLAAAAVSPAGDLIVGAGSGGLLLWERNYDGRYVRTSGPSAGFPVRVIEINADGDRIVVGGTSPVVTVMDRRGALVRELPGHRPDVVSIAATPSAAWVATLDRARGVRLWSTADARPDPVELTGHSGDVLKVALSSDGSQVVAGGLAGRIWVWQRAKPAEPMELDGHGAPVTAIALTPNGRRLVSGADDGTVRLWDIPGKAEIDVRRPRQPRPGLLSDRESADDLLGFGDDVAGLATMIAHRKPSRRWLSR